MADFQQRVGAVILDDDGDQIGGTNGLLTRTLTTGDHPQWKSFMLTDDGLENGDDNAIGNYAAANTQFWHAATEELVVIRMFVHIEDTVGMADADYGNITGGVTNGVVVRHYATNGTTIKNTLTAWDTSTSPDGIKTNAEWRANCYDAQINNVGSGNDFLNVRWTFAKAGTPIHLATGERISVLLNDDFSGLIKHQFIIQGYYAGTWE
jgi:hypothetical protein